jgi:murein DD-endopeptidase MepM/ murein hydrolase activator NlpD
MTALRQTLRRTAWAGLLLAAVAAAAHAGKVLRWQGEDGARRYGDHLPQGVDPTRTPVTRLALGAEHEPVARLRLENTEAGVEAWAENTLYGPIEVLLRQPAGPPLRADPPLPARALVPAQQRVLLALLRGDRPVELRMEVVPGSPNAQPRDVEYLYPLQADRVRIEQGYGGGHSHNDAQNRHAVDFAAAIGTPVLAARAGTVMELESDYDRAGLDPDTYVDRANFVRIVHDDGTMALYAHLQQDGVLVRSGQRVRKGQIIARSGNTGFSSGPHLHFVVQVNRGMKLESIPFRMFGPGGILRFTEPSAP